jgi:L-rhamnose mutarotase
VQAIEESGLRNYSIYRHGLTLLGYVETDDIEYALGYLRGNEVNWRWGDWIASIMKAEANPKTKIPLPTSLAVAHGLGAHANSSAVIGGNED